MAKLTKKNKQKKGDPEAPYSTPLPGAPAGHNIAKKHIVNDVNDYG
jgi:hypothetical protein